MLLINVVTGEKQQLTENEYSIGRSESCDIVIKEPTLSRKHAVLSRTGNDWFIEDLGSTNGIAINGEKIAPAERVRIHAGDRVVLGTTVPLVFEGEEIDEERTVGVQFFRKERELEVKERPETPVRSEPEVPLRPVRPSTPSARPLWAENAAPVQQKAAPVQPKAAPVQPKAAPVQPKAAPVRPNAAPRMSFREYINTVADPRIKNQVNLSAIIMYICCAVMILIAVIRQIYGSTWLNPIYVALGALAVILPLTVLMHVLKSRGCAIALIPVTAVSFLSTLAINGEFGGFLPLVGSITAVIALSRAKKAYTAYLSQN